MKLDNWVLAEPRVIRPNGEAVGEGWRTELKRRLMMAAVAAFVIVPVGFSKPLGIDASAANAGLIHKTKKAARHAGNDVPSPGLHVGNGTIKAVPAAKRVGRHVRDAGTQIGKGAKKMSHATKHSGRAAKSTAKPIRKGAKKFAQGVKSRTH
jgi:hypothetical protein